MYLDTAILVKLLVREPDSLHYVRLVDGQLAWSSQVAVTELHAALLRKERESALSAAHRRRVLRQIERDINDRRLSLIPVTTELLASANTILDACHPTIPLRSLDAIHLASARESRSWPLCTNDDRMRRAAQRLAIPLCPLPG